ncbi:Tripartite-type tricarboxylate transporter, receptor component TctC [Bradyrhizobium lablabi]|jgi:tripartite-type tricarboxylate transporter receptor subunit TctC|uniref:Tripartite-type tricarboxylate transporter, receptor component TctC n=3 Tax=Nitrobacteraceae TaxID=41294 RepID=A0ABY0PQV0_9BRAD|nr:Tripartite-type tricarboxylate transporter, receptor component TctC [Bradyrhizobium ottawaense]SED31007.1 Tripartite-type tricarboxylate transporter, receptor component TctC [Bradyrhizobium lablabi]SHL34337.1 Tripartite-type tricarboxylate transporter, receptor component TctC [Bradyrhizobium lablabi]
MEMGRGVRGNLLALVFALAWAVPAVADGFPSRTIKIVVPAAAGGPTHITAQLLAEKMQVSLGQPVIVEPKPGAGNNLGAEFVAKSPPDGYTLLLATTGTHAINQTLFKHLPFDPIKDFEPVSLVVQYPLLLVVSPDLPVNSVKELIDYAKKNPGKLNRASGGNGTSMHLSGELFVHQAGIDAPHVPYRGSAPALNDLMGNHVQLMFDSMITALPLVEGGKLRALAVTGKKRSPLLPNIPTLAESGLPDYEATGWTGIVVPAKTPPDVIATLNAAIVQALKSPELQQAFEKQAAEPVGSTPAEFGAFIRKETDKWGKTIREAGISVE